LFSPEPVFRNARARGSLRSRSASALEQSTC
jgi:hypothetical protein